MPAESELIPKIEGLLHFAAKPLPSLSLRDGAATAAYLNHLAYELPPGAEREDILRLSRIVWGRVFQFGKFKRATKSEAIAFLQEIASTHLCDVDSRSMLRTVRLFPEPRLFKTPRMLVSPGMARTGVPKQVRSDLTERICAAYWALRFAKVPRAGQTVADVLNRLGISQGRKVAGGGWTSYEVAERVKQAEHKKTPRSREEDRRWLVQRWGLAEKPI